MRHPIVWSVALVAIVVSGCGERMVAITTQPAEAVLVVNGRNLGPAPKTHQFTFRDEAVYSVTAFKEGFYNEVVTLTKDSDAIHAGILNLVLEPDHCWTSTTISQATNTWLRLPVDPGLSREVIWQKVVDAVTTRYDSLEQIDAASGYLRSSPRLKSFKVNGTTVALRNQFYCAQASFDPLVYKVKVVSERSVAGTDWKPYGRIFKADADLVNELMVRMGQSTTKPPKR